MKTIIAILGTLTKPTKIDYLQHHQPQLDIAFGLRKNQKIDGITYQE